MNTSNITPNMWEVEGAFTAIKGKFITPVDELQKKLKKIKAFIFDWDGVFNNGSKIGNEGSNFAEPDAMGLNMLKLDYWLRKGILPYTYVVTGEENKIAQYLVQREHMNAVYNKCKFKVKALERICQENELKPQEIAFVFDDILDVELARSCGVSFQITRTSNPLFNQYLEESKSCDYRTGTTGGNHAVREVCELIIGLTGNLNNAIETRIKFTGKYTDFLKDRNTITPICEPLE